MKITAQECFDQAQHHAAWLDSLHDTRYEAAMATVGLFWAELGQFCLAMGDPHEEVSVHQQRRQSRLFPGGEG